MVEGAMLVEVLLFGIMMLAFYAAYSRVKVEASKKAIEEILGSDKLHARYFEVIKPDVDVLNKKVDALELAVKNGGGVTEPVLTRVLVGYLSETANVIVSNVNAKIDQTVGSGGVQEVVEDDVVEEVPVVVKPNPKVYKQPHPQVRQVVREQARTVQKNVPTPAIEEETDEELEDISQDFQPVEEDGVPYEEEQPEFNPAKAPQRINLNSQPKQVGRPPRIPRPHAM